MKRRRSSSGSAGFTLAELLVVVAIIGVLVGISIPLFSGQLEKARRAVDVSNARSLLSTLKTEYSSGEIEFTSDRSANRADGMACVTVSVGTNEMQICASTNIKIMGTTADAKTALENHITSCGLGNLRVKSRTSEENGGWDFYTVILYSDGSSRIASGTLQKGQVGAWSTTNYNFEYNANYWKTRKALSTIEQAMTKS